MRVVLLQNGRLDILVTAIRKCHDSGDKSDTVNENLGPNDKALIKRIIDMDHTSTLEHVSYTFDVSGLSRAALQELARHRHASLSVKSTRYTLKELLADVDLGREELARKYCVIPPKEAIGMDLSTVIGDQLMTLQGSLRLLPNDHAKFLLPEAYKTSLVWSINARSLRNFFDLRTSKRALWEMRELAANVWAALPTTHRFLFEDVMHSLPRPDMNDIMVNPVFNAKTGDIDWGGVA